MKLFVLLFLFSIKAVAVNCGLGALQSRDVFAMQEYVYWLSAGGEHYMMMMKSPNLAQYGSATSFAFDLKTRQMHPVSNDIDGYPSPDGEFFVVPHPFRIYRTADAIRDYKTTMPLLTDDQLHDGDYGSVGVRKVNGKTFLRVVQESERGAILKEYEIEGTGSATRFRPTTEKPLALCQNLGPRSDLFTEMPIVSRDGTLLGVSSYPKNTTQIYKIEMPSGYCRLLADVGTQTGKVSFSFDNQKVLFKNMAPAPAGHANGRRSPQLVEFDLQTKKSRVVVGSPEKPTYQAYRPDGSIAYGRNNNGVSELAIIDAPPMRLSAEANTVGEAWVKACHFESASQQSFSILGHRLDAETCRSLLYLVSDQQKPTVSAFCSAKLHTSSGSASSAY